MNSYPSIETLAELPEEGTEETFIFTISEGEDEYQQVDDLRITRLSRAQARWEGALSEIPGRVGTRRR